MTLEQAIASSHQLRPHTKKQYVRSVRSFVAFAGDNPSRWTGSVVESYRDAELARGASPSYVNTRVSAIKKASQRWAALGHGSDFAAAAELLPTDTGKKRSALTWSAAQKLVAACEGDSPTDLRDMAIIVFMARTGIRREGLVSIQFSDVVAAPTSAGRLVTIILKGGKRHKLLLDDETWDTLATWMAWLLDHGCNSGPIFRGIRTMVAVDGVIGDGLSVTGLHAVIKRRAARAGMPKVHGHLLRHSCISWLREAGVPDWRIAQLTGHKVLTAPGVPVVPQLGTYTTDLSGVPVSNALPWLRRHS